MYNNDHGSDTVVHDGNPIPDGVKDAYLRRLILSLTRRVVEVPAPDPIPGQD